MIRQLWAQLRIPRTNSHKMTGRTSQKDQHMNILWSNTFRFLFFTSYINQLIKNWVFTKNRIFENRFTLYVKTVFAENRIFGNPGPSKNLSFIKIEFSRIYFHQQFSRIEFFYEKGCFLGNRFSVRSRPNTFVKKAPAQKKA